MRISTIVVAVTSLLFLDGAQAAADGLRLGCAVGAAVPTGGIGGLTGPTPAVSGWVSGGIRGPYAWRAEFGRLRLGMPDDTRLACSAANVSCKANLGVSHVGGGLQVEPRAVKAVAPYGYVTVGLYHLAAQADVNDLSGGTVHASISWSDNAFGVAIGSGVRVRLSDRWTVRAEFRYSGFTYEPGTVHWASIVTPTVNLSVGF